MFLHFYILSADVNQPSALKGFGKYMKMAYALDMWNRSCI